MPLFQLFTGHIKVVNHQNSRNSDYTILSHEDNKFSRRNKWNRT